MDSYLVRFHSIAFLLSAWLCMSINIPQASSSARSGNRHAPKGTIRLWSILRRSHLLDSSSKDCARQLVQHHRPEPDCAHMPSFTDTKETSKLPGSSLAGYVDVPG